MTILRQHLYDKTRQHNTRKDNNDKAGQNKTKLDNTRLDNDMKRQAYRQDKTT